MARIAFPRIFTVPHAPVSCPSYLSSIDAPASRLTPSGTSAFFSSSSVVRYETPSASRVIFSSAC